jgi:hypothetical protein
MGKLLFAVGIVLVGFVALCTVFAPVLAQLQVLLTF